MANTKKGQQPFWVGGAAACTAACFTHPLDQMKYRMQVQASKQNMFRALYVFASRDGIRSLWSGLSASVLRQSSYSSTRFGVYSYLVHEARQRSERKELSTSSIILCAGLAGGIAGLVGNPTEVILVRMCADGAKSPDRRFGYSNAVQGLLRVWKEEGLRTFSRGLAPNVVRSVLMNVSQIATYAAMKAQLLTASSLENGVPVHILSSLAAGTVATTVCAPADVLKSRMQSSVAANGQKMSTFQSVQNSLKAEGPGFLMRGWTPAWLRLTPNTVLMFVFMEQLQRLVDSRPWFRSRADVDLPSQEAPVGHRPV